MRLAGAAALVTGATAGIGRATALRFAAEGATVVVTGRDLERGAAVEAAGEGRVRFIAADLGSADERAALVDATIGALGGLTVLVNCAVARSAGLDGPVTETTPAAWRALLEVNLIAAADLCRHAIPHLTANGGGAIVNVSSRAATRASSGRVAYPASKAGLEALSRSIALDHADQGIRCNTVSPGYVINDRRDADLSPERRLEIEAMHLTRLPTADDIANAIVFLASDEASTITGTLLHVDGGGHAVRGRTLG